MLPSGTEEFKSISPSKGHKTDKEEEVKVATKTTQRLSFGVPPRYRYDKDIKNTCYFKLTSYIPPSLWNEIQRIFWECYGYLLGFST